MARSPDNNLVCRALTEATFCGTTVIGELHMAYYAELELTPTQLSASVRRARAKAAQMLAAIDAILTDMDRPADETETALQAAE